MDQGPTMPDCYDPDEYSRNLAQYNKLMMQKAYHSFGGHGKTSPQRLTSTQTFSKEEKGAVHLLYDPDFRDENDFRYDMRKQAMSPGPGAHKDPLKSFKNVIHQNGKYSFPKVRLPPFIFGNDPFRQRDLTTKLGKFGMSPLLTPICQMKLTERWLRET